MPMTIDLTKSREELERLTQIQAEQIRDVYKDSLKTVQSKLVGLKSVETATASLQTARLTQLEKDLTKELSKASAKVESIVTGTMTATAKAVVTDNAAFLKTIGMDVKGALAHVPPDVVASLSTGQVYAGDWSLSKSLWTAEKKAQNDIQQVIAQGVAQNKSSFEIAKDLEKYVDPSKAKDWAWNKVYPGTSARVDYNAQRLARTMTAHAYQQSLVMTVKDNPFVTGIKWKSAHAAGRTCELCEQRDGTVFAKDELPLDHPNGLCSWIPAIPDSYEDISKRIGEWKNDGTDPAMDKFAESLGYKKPIAAPVIKAPVVNVPQTKAVTKIEGLTDVQSMKLETANLRVTKQQEILDAMDLNAPKDGARGFETFTAKRAKVAEKLQDAQEESIKLQNIANKKLGKPLVPSTKIPDVKIVDIADDLKGINIPEGIKIPDGLTPAQKVRLKQLKVEVQAISDELSPSHAFVGKTDDWLNERVLLRETRKKLEKEISQLAKIETDRADAIFDLKFNLSKYQNMTQKEMTKVSDDFRHVLTRDEKIICDKYFQNPYSFELNEFMYSGEYDRVSSLISSGLKGQLTSEQITKYDEVTQFTKLLSKQSLKEDIKLIRYTDIDQLEDVLKQVGQADKLGSGTGLEEISNSIKGAKFTQKSFMSTSFETSENVFTNRAVQIEIYASKGTQAVSTPNVSSSYNGKRLVPVVRESEVVINAGTDFEILGMEHKNGKILLKLRTIV